MSLPAIQEADLREPIDFSEHLYELELSLGQVCQVVGIAKTQLDYLTVNSLETVVLVK